MRRRFFVEGFEGQSGVLRGEAAHHLARVLRAAPGQLYELSDGSAVWLGRVERVTNDVVEFALVEQVAAREQKLRTTLLLSIVKFDRFEWALEKATELGVAEIVPLASARSEGALVKISGKRADRWRRILLESAQQARRLRLPQLSEAISPADAFALAGAQPRSGEAAPVLLSERAEAPQLRRVLDGRKASSAFLAIGPEGGWTEEEFAAARTAGFWEASLGENILRTETAVVAALAMMNYALGE